MADDAANARQALREHVATTAAGLGKAIRRANDDLRFRDALLAVAHIGRVDDFVAQHFTEKSNVARELHEGDV